MYKFNIGDIVYIIKYHKINNKAEYYTEKCRICYYKPYLYYVKFKNIYDNSNDNTTKGLYTYREHRLFKTIEEAEKELELKNKELILREEYYKNIKELRKND